MENELNITDDLETFKRKISNYPEIEKRIYSIADHKLAIPVYKNLSLSQEEISYISKMISLLRKEIGIK